MSSPDHQLRSMNEDLMEENRLMAEQLKAMREQLAVLNAAGFVPGWHLGQMTQQEQSLAEQPSAASGPPGEQTEIPAEQPKGASGPPGEHHGIPAEQPSSASGPPGEQDEIPAEQPSPAGPPGEPEEIPAEKPQPPTPGTDRPDEAQAQHRWHCSPIVVENESPSDTETAAGDDDEARRLAARSDELEMQPTVQDHACDAQAGKP
eukprot:8240162-Pyramimonas_sp.AAC.1